MGKFSEVLFTADFDHTLSGPDGSVPKRNIDAIRTFMNEGGRFCVNSGRSVALLRDVVKAVPTNAPCLCSNGAVCYDFSAQEQRYATPLPDNAPELLQKMLALGDDFGVEIQRLDGHYSLRPSARDLFLLREGITPVRTDASLPLPWMKFVICVGKDENVLSQQATQEQKARIVQLRQKMEEICGETCYVVHSLPLVLEIGRRGCDKGGAARKLADSLGRRILVCAGDAPNDLQMLQAADLAFVPADANPEILSLPGVHIAAPSGEGCIADAIVQLGRLIPR